MFALVAIVPSFTLSALLINPAYNEDATNITPLLPVLELISTRSPLPTVWVTVIFVPGALIVILSALGVRVTIPPGTYCRSSEPEPEPPAVNLWITLAPLSTKLWEYVVSLSVAEIVRAASLVLVTVTLLPPFIKTYCGFSVLPSTLRYGLLLLPVFCTQSKVYLSSVLSEAGIVTVFVCTPVTWPLAFDVTAEIAVNVPP